MIVRSNFVKMIAVIMVFHSLFKYIYIYIIILSIKVFAKKIKLPTVAENVFVKINILVMIAAYYKYYS